MKKLLILFLFLTSCSEKIPKTSLELMELGNTQCSDTPELDMQRAFCVIAFAKAQCEIKQLDLRICGKIDKL